MKVKIEYSRRLKRSIKIQKKITRLIAILPSFMEKMELDDQRVLNTYLLDKYKFKKKVNKQIISNLFLKYNVTNGKIRRKFYTDDGYHSLELYFVELNKIYFNNRLKNVQLAWSFIKSRRLLGKYCEESEAIILSSYLNKKSISKEIVKYILYHEMCHLAHPPFIKNGRRKVHHQAFRLKENEYENKEKIEKLLLKI